jgi:hypothetical protein
MSGRPVDQPASAADVAYYLRAISRASDGRRDPGHAEEGSESSDFRNDDDAKGHEDEQTKLNRRMEEDAMLREIAARDLKKEGRMDKVGASLLRRSKGGSKK